MFAYKTIGTSLFLVITALAIVACSGGITPAPPSAPVERTSNGPTVAKQPWETDWEKTLAEGKKEGKVVIYNTRTGETRKALEDAFSSNYNIVLESVVGRGPELLAKIELERRAGLFLADIYFGGSQSPIMDLKPKGYLAPLRPLFVLPEVLDARAWYGGEIYFGDKEKQYVVSPVLATSKYFVVYNTELVRPGDLKSYKDLLAPRWKAKIIYADPTQTGGLRFFSVTAERYMGLDYFRDFVKNEPVITRDVRLQIEGVARGKYAIAIIGQSDVVGEFMKLGAPIKTWMPAEGGFLVGGGGSIAYLDRAPHPNATKVFINWFLSREGQTVYSKVAVIQSARLDVSTDHLPKDDLRVEGFNYYNPESEEFFGKQQQYEKLAREIFAPLLR